MEVYLDNAASTKVDKRVLAKFNNIAETLYAEKNPVFIQKFYNMHYNNIEKIINKRRK